jgi:multidrug resistance protein MdtO
VSELQRTVDLLQLSLSPAGNMELVSFGDAPPTQAVHFLPDALTNPDHLMYSLRGCLAAMLCYVIFNAVAWRGLSTSLATCVITALSSIGSSRQKQVLRISGAIVGGLFFGIGSQVLILPMLDSISGFTVLFSVVTFIAAWFATSSPRLSYFGLQIALAFYLIHLQEYFPQTNLGIARDRVMGIALGLVMMWLVFDTLGSRPAAEVMRKLFATNLGLLADLATPWREGKLADLKEIRQTRDRLSTSFGSVNAQADAVLFEIGPTRAQDLLLRERLLGWQPKLRSLFLIEIGLLQYRLQISPDELAPEVVNAQQRFDEAVTEALRIMAHTISTGEPAKPGFGIQAAYEGLRDALQSTYKDGLTARAKGVLAYSANIAEVLDSLTEEIPGATKDLFA